MSGYTMLLMLSQQELPVKRDTLHSPKKPSLVPRPAPVRLHESRDFPSCNRKSCGPGSEARFLGLCRVSLFY